MSPAVEKSGAAGGRGEPSILLVRDGTQLCARGARVCLRRDLCKLVDPRHRSFHEGYARRVRELSLHRLMGSTPARGQFFLTRKTKDKNGRIRFVPAHGGGGGYALPSKAVEGRLQGRCRAGVWEVAFAGQVRLHPEAFSLSHSLFAACAGLLRDRRTGRQRQRETRSERDRETYFLLCVSSHDISVPASVLTPHLLVSPSSDVSLSLCLSLSFFVPAHGQIYFPLKTRNSPRFFFHAFIHRGVFFALLHLTRAGRVRGAAGRPRWLVPSPTV